MPEFNLYFELLIFLTAETTNLYLRLHEFNVLWRMIVYIYEIFTLVALFVKLNKAYEHIYFVALTIY